jgi:hypothetical protein
MCLSSTAIFLRKDFSYFFFTFILIGTVDGKICFSTIFQKQWTPFSISLTGNACQQIPSVTFTFVKLAIVNTFVQNVVY